MFFLPLLATQKPIPGVLGRIAILAGGQSGDEGVFQIPSRLTLLLFKEGTLVAVPTCMESNARLPQIFGN